jgi:hypothetical protein
MGEMDEPKETDRRLLLESEIVAIGLGGVDFVSCLRAIQYMCVSVRGWSIYTIV